MNQRTVAYQNELIQAIQSLPLAKLEHITDMLFQVRQSRNTVFVLGNGGSAATPSHSAGDWSHALHLKTLCLTDNTSMVTAIANDHDYKDVFQVQLGIFLNKGDVVIGFSGSGNSPNVVRAINYAKDQDAYTVGITGNYKGKQGGSLAEISDLSIVVDTTSMEQIEDLHLIITHMIKDLFIRKYGHEFDPHK